MARVIDEPREFANPDDFNTQVREYLQVKNTAEMLDARKEDLRKNLFSHLEGSGELDDKGNYFIELPQPIDGIVRLEKQKRTIRKLDEQTAEEVLKDNGLEDEIYETVRVVNEDKLMAAYYEGKISEDELERMFPAKISWALRTAKK